MSSVFGVQPYTRSGAVDWGRFVPWTLACFGVAGLMSIVLYLFGVAGFHFYIILPVATAVPVAAMLRIAVQKGHCRSRSVALVSGVLAGSILYFGSFYIDMVRFGGPEIGARVDLLPRFIAARMEIDQVQNNGKVASSSAAANWLFFALDVIAIWGTIGAAGYEATGRAYCEDCRAWLSQTNFHLAAGLAEDLSEIIVDRRLGELPELPSYDAQPAEANTMLTIEYCPGRLEGASRCSAYVTVAEQSAPDRNNTRENKKFLKQHPLSNAELRTLAAKAAPLRRLVGDELAPAGENRMTAYPDLEEPVLA